MDALPYNSKTAIEANAYLEMVAENYIPIIAMLSRNRVLSNTAVIEFEKTNIHLGLHNNIVKIKSKNGATLVGFPEKIQAPIKYNELFEVFYKNLILKKNNTEVCIQVALKSQEIIEKAYQNANLMYESF